MFSEQKNTNQFTSIFDKKKYSYSSIFTFTSDTEEDIFLGDEKIPDYVFSTTTSEENFSSYMRPTRDLIIENDSEKYYMKNMYDFELIESSTEEDLFLPSVYIYLQNYQQ